MKAKFPLLLLLSIAVTVLAGCHHWPSPWDGQWTLDESKSHFAAPTFTVSVSSEGMYHIDDGAIDYSFRCDGNPYPTAAGTGGFISCTQTDPKTIVLKEKTNGPDSTYTRWELSADGKTLTTIARLIQIGGSAKDKPSSPSMPATPAPAIPAQAVSLRPLESGPGLSIPRSKTVVLILNYNHFHFEDSDWGQFSRLPRRRTPKAHPRRQSALRIFTLRKDPRSPSAPDRRHLFRPCHPSHHLESQRRRKDSIRGILGTGKNPPRKICSSTEGTDRDAEMRQNQQLHATGIILDNIYIDQYTYQT